MAKKNEDKLRHKVCYRVVRPLLKIFLKSKFGYKYKKVKGLKGNYIVVSNHTTDYDPLFVTCSFPKSMYFVASEHITRWKKTYAFLNYAFSPIIRYKGTVASSTVMEILRKVRRGNNVCIFAEGVRSWTGETGEILPSTAKMIKAAKCGLVTYKITGGYFVSPVWGTAKCRKGYVSGAPVRVYSKEEIEKMSEDEIYEILKNDLYENAHTTQKELHKKYKGKGLAEGLENLIFKCPNCGEMDSLRSCKNSLKCEKCNNEFSINEYGEISGIDYENISSLNEWQIKEILKDIKKDVVYKSDGVLSSIGRDHSKLEIAKGDIEMTPKYFRCDNVKFDMEDITDLAIYGKYGLVFSANGEYFEILPNKTLSVYKFLIYYKYIKNKSKEI